jgi:two-component system phosphate regulon sensor histidine kinase PhoR
MSIPRKRSFRSRIFISFFAAFTLFTVAILLFQYEREKNYRAAQLENTLDNITTFAHNFIEQNQLLNTGQIGKVDSLLSLLPGTNERLTVIDSKGVVLYDSEVDEVASMENHLMRPEVQKSLYSTSGSSIRKSATTQLSYYYYSKYFNHYYIRTAVLYNVEVKDFLKTERIFIVFILSLFILMWILFRQVTKRLGNFISKLRDFAVSAAIGEEIEKIPEFPDRELDVIGKKIVSIYNNLNKAKYDLVVEKEKLFEHLHVLAEGIAFYTRKNELKLSNSHFVQYLNLISESSTISVPDLFEIEAFKPIVKFIKKAKTENLYQKTELPTLTITIEKGDNYFEVKAIVFADKSFEILITDVTKLEKRRLLKQHLTSNIAHELKTPVTSMKGYLETILNSKDLPAEKQRHFIERAFLQSERLTDLLNDISLLNNIEDAGDLFEFKEVKVRELIDEVIENRKMRLDEQNIKSIIDVQDDISIVGNDSLLNSVFQNLIENTIKYAGENVKIIIRNYHTDEKNYYFSYVDTGIGIPEEHQARIFERFYRIEEGRSRQTGGTGLGLSIVKNAILLHKGEIKVHNRPEGGIEFLFSLPKI